MITVYITLGGTLSLEDYRKVRSHLGAHPGDCQPSTTGSTTYKFTAERDDACFYDALSTISTYYNPSRIVVHRSELPTPAADAQRDETIDLGCNCNGWDCEICFPVPFVADDEPESEYDITFEE